MEIKKSKMDRVVIRTTCRGIKDGLNFINDNHYHIMSITATKDGRSGLYTGELQIVAWRMIREDR